MARGFDNEIWWADGRAVRIPRRAVAVPALINEQQWLNKVVSDLPLEAPAVMYRGAPSIHFPYPWSITHFCEGTPGIVIAPTTRGNSAKQLGAALRALHHEAPSDAPTNPFRGVALAQRQENLLTRLAQVDSSTRSVVLHYFERGVNAAEHSGPGVWLHGDVHPGNLIFREGELVGLIDFSDLCAGDPAVDVGGALFSLPAERHREFWSAYSDVDHDLHARAYGWAALFAILHLQIGLDEYTALGNDGLAWLCELD